MDSQGANRKLGSKNYWAKIGPVLFIYICIVPFPHWYHFLLLIVKIHLHYWTQAKSIHKFLGVFWCLTKGMPPFYPRCQGDVWSLSLGMARWKPCTQLGSLDWLKDAGVDTRWVLGMLPFFFRIPGKVNKDFPETMEIMQINTPQLVKDSKNSSGLQICVGLRSIFNIVHPFWASVGFLGYQMEPCAKGSSSRCMDMLLWSVLPRHARRINSNDLFGPSVNEKSWRNILNIRSIECWSFINPRVQASQRVWEGM